MSDELSGRVGAGGGQPAPDIARQREVYDEWYRRRAAHWEDAPGKAVLIAALRRCCRADQALRVLDIGCGLGSFLRRIGEEVSGRWELHGVDLSEVAVVEGRRRAPQLHLECGDATHLQVTDGFFDVATCYGSWEHFPQPAAAIAEAARVLKPGGWALAMIPALGVHRTDREDEGWYEDTEVPGSDRRQGQWNLTRGTWEEMFERADLLLLGDHVAAAAGAQKPGVFFFATKASCDLHQGSAARGFADLGLLAGRLSRQLVGAIERAAVLLGECLESGGRILVCGNGGSAADAQHFVAELVGRLTRERRGLPAVALGADTAVVTAVANDFGYERVFARQVEALGRQGDVLLGISTSGRSANVLEALHCASSTGLVTISLFGDGEECAEHDLSIRIPSPDTQRVQEAHLAVLHALAEELDRRVAGEDIDHGARRGSPPAEPISRED